VQTGAEDVLTTVASFAEPWNAHILRGRLEAEGIFALVVHEHHVGMIWPWALALSGVKVQVLDDEWEAARDVARRGLAGEYQRELASRLGPLKDTYCPNCLSTDFNSCRSIPRLFLQAFLYWYFEVIIPLSARVHRCRQCGTKWWDRFG
jgi:hypothetical protein